MNKKTKKNLNNRVKARTKENTKNGQKVKLLKLKRSTKKSF